MVNRGHKSEHFNQRRTVNVNVTAKGKGQKRQALDDKLLHRNLEFEQHVPHKTPGMISCAPEVLSVLVMWKSIKYGSCMN